MSAVLQIDDISVRYETASGPLTAVRNVSLSVARGECLGLVGESGCGKSTLGKAVVGLVPVTAGQVAIGGQRVSGLSARALRPLRRLAQMVFQDPQSSLNPRLTVGRIVEEPLIVNGIGDGAGDRRERVRACLERVGLPADAAQRYPHEFSGGQRQRIGIARALVLVPELIVADECVSALDVSVQAQIVNLLVQLKKDLGQGMLFISHDLGVVQTIADRVAVMYLGNIVESGRRSTFWRRPLHPYTRGLIDAVPVPDPRRVRDTRTRFVVEGEVPSPYAPPKGCAFHPRCPFADSVCRTQAPTLRKFDDGSEVACHHVALEGRGTPVPVWSRQP